MKPYRLRFEVDTLPKRMNEVLWKHWSSKHRERNKWKVWIGHIVLAEGKPKVPLRKAKVRLTRFSSREPDFDGLVSSWKFILDSLIDAGVIEDDNQKVIGVPEYVWEKAKPKEGKIRVEVEEMFYVVGGE